MRESLAYPEKDTASGCPLSAFDASMAGWFPRNAGDVIGATGVERVVGVGDPGHFSLSGSHVGSRHVLPGSDEVLLDEFGREPAGDLFDLLFAVVTRIEPNTTLRTTERDVHDRALERHQSRQCDDFVLVDEGTEADAALYGLAVLAVLGPPALKDLVVVSPETDGELEEVNAVAGPDLRKKRGIDFEMPCRSIEIFAHDLS